MAHRAADLPFAAERVIDGNSFDNGWHSLWTASNVFHRHLDLI
jgi:hypothetical protein